jgi:hypothetical protein
MKAQELSGFTGVLRALGSETLCADPVASTQHTRSVGGVHP